MTDVSRLQTLAGLISRSSPRIRDYALAQALATVQQEAVIRRLQMESDNMSTRLDTLESIVDRFVSSGGVIPGGGGAGSALPFAEAQLRAGFQTATIPVGTFVWTPPTGADYLVDLQWLARTQRLRILGYNNQRIKVINGYWNITSGSGYGAGGFGARTNDATGAEHISLTDFFVTGNLLLDGVVIDATDNTKLTLQRGRIESGSLISGTPVAELLEHIDAFQVQGPSANIEMGLMTIFVCSVNAGNDAGKGLMLGSAWGPYTTSLNKVNFRDSAGLAGCGAYIFQDSTAQLINLVDVYAHKEATVPTWASGSALFWSQDAGHWTSSGTAPNRVANFDAGRGINGVVYEGLPPGGDYCTRAMLGF